MVDTMVVMKSIGTCTIQASQAGNSNFNPVQVERSVQLVPQADLWIEKTAEQATALIGDTVGYSIFVGNDGPADASDVRVLDLPPERLGDVVWNCVEASETHCPVPGADADTLDATVSLPKGAVLRFELFGTVLSASYPVNEFIALENTASVTLPDGSTLIDPIGNNQSTANVLIVPKELFNDGFEASENP